MHPGWPAPLGGRRGSRGPGPAGRTQLCARLGLDRTLSRAQPAWPRAAGRAEGWAPAPLSLRPPPPPQDAFARGEVFIGSRESGYTVLDRLPASTQGHHWPHGITIVTPERRFLLACETEAEQRAWVEAFRKVVDRPMLPQEYAGEGRPGRARGAAGWPGHSLTPVPLPVEAHFKHKP